MSRRLLLLLALLVPAADLWADDHPNTARGFAADKVFQVGDVDNVNLFNGNLTLTIPIGGSYPAGGGLSYGLTLVYNSNVWEFQDREDDATGQVFHQGLPQRTSNAGLGWLLTLGRLLSPTTPGNDTERWLYQGSDGSEHVFYPTLHVGDAEDPGDNPMDPVNQTVTYTRDGSYLRMKVVTAGAREIEFPNGQVHHFDTLWRLSQIRDRFGNALNVAYSSLLWTLTDTQGRTHRVYFQNVMQNNQPIEAVQRVELAAFGGATATYNFSYGSATIGRACPHNDGTIGNFVQVPLLTSVSLPDGSSYQMPVSDYITELTPSSPVCRSSGVIRGLTLPTLGRLEWTYQHYVYPAGAGKIHFGYSAGVMTRRTKDASGNVLGTWTYTPSDGITDPSEVVRTVTDPLSHRTEHYFVPSPGSHEYSLPFRKDTTDGAGRFLSTQTFNSAGTLVRTGYVLYDADQRPTVWNDQQELYNVNRRELSSRTVYNDDGSKYADLDRADFDGMGHYRTETTGGNFNAGDVRTTTVTYNTARGTYRIDPATNQPAPGHNFSMWPAGSPWVLEFFDSRQETEGGVTAFSRHCFDADTGFLRRQRTLKNSGTAEANTDLLAAYTPDAAGNLQTEQYFGGDTQTITANNTTCTMGLPAPKYRIDHTYQAGVRATSQYSGVTFFSLDQTIDGPSGLPSQSRDASSIATDYEFDLLGRLTWSKPAVGHDGWTEYVYSRALSSSSLADVLVRRRNNGSKTAAVLAQSQIFFDALGRVWQEKQLLPSGSWNVRETLYDIAGHKASVSELQTGTPTKKTQFLNYDPFGRATTIRPPDGSAHDVTLSYFGLRVVERTVQIATAGGIESAATTTETYDRQGRLLSVKEPSGAADALVTTTYSYDVGNRLRQVQTSSGGVTQNRFFTYDNRGFLTSETHPEKGSSGNGNVTYSSYDARGHAGQKTDGPSDLTFTYDTAERLTLVRETSGLQRTLKSFTYAAANGNYTDPITGTSCFDYRKGKIAQQSRFNYVTVNGGPSTVELREGMTYCGRGGRMSRQSLENWVNGGLNEAFFLPNVTYDALGNVTSLEYPRCTHAACTAPSPRTVTSSYTNGFLTTVRIPGNAGSYASSITYHPNLMVNQVVHGNTLTDTYANDPDAMRRPGSITVTTPTAAQRWATGTYAYDGAGNVKAIGTHAFAYDKVSRLKTADLYLEPTSSVNLRTQTYTYDAFGNIQAIGGSSARNTPTSSSTNRLTAGGYDGAGNLTSWNGNTYQYDPFNLMWNYHTLSDEWIYLYTADDERAWSYKIGNTSLWTLRGPDGKVLREYSSGASWAVESDYIYRDGSLLAAETPQGLRHFHLDHLGTPRLVTASGGAGDFYTLTPCRVLDTRNPSAPLSAGETRTVPMVGACGVPSGASAVSVNITVVDATAQGELTAFPANESRPTASAISYPVSFARANNAVLKLGNGALSFFVNQPSGSAHLIIDVNGYFTEEAGSTVAYHVYYSFGEEATAFNQDTIREKFTGHERDLGNLGGPGDDLDYMHQRFCSPLTGRFLSTDPSQEGQNPAAPQSWNQYAYALGNPLKYVDPDGMAAKCPPEGCPEWLWPTTFWQRLQKGLYEASFLPSPSAMAVGPRAGGSLISALLAKFGFGGFGTSASGRIAALGSTLKNIFSQNLTKATAQAAARESLGEVVAVKATGEAFDHMTKYGEAREGAAQAIDALKRLASDQRLSDRERAFAEYLLREYSKKLDAIEKIYQTTLTQAPK